jgi:branched-chain amino acid transport system permease protein
VSWFSDNELLIQSALAVALLAYSFQVAMRSGVFSLAGVGFWAIGGYTTAYLVDHGWKTAPAILVALAASFVIAIGLALVLGRLRALYLGMATVAFVLLIQVVAVNWESFTGGAGGLYAIPVTITTTQLLIVVAAVSVALVFFERGARGRRIEALRIDEQLAQSLGVNASRERMHIFVFSSLLGCLSGAISAMMFNTLAPEQAGFSLVAAVLMMVVIGGTSAWWGALIGAFVVTWLPEIFRFADEWRTVLQAALVIAVVVYAPEGIVGGIRRLTALVSHRRVRPSATLGGGTAQDVVAHEEPVKETVG